MVRNFIDMRDAGFVQADQPPMPRLAAAYGSVTPPVRKMSPVPPHVAKPMANQAVPPTGVHPVDESASRTTVSTGVTIAELTYDREPLAEALAIHLARGAGGGPWIAARIAALASAGDAAGVRRFRPVAAQCERLICQVPN